MTLIINCVSVFFFKKYVNNIISIKINGVEKTGKGGIKATDLFDADGNINFNAAIKGKDGMIIAGK